MSEIKHGRCGNGSAPIVGATTPRQLCALTWGHGGWHRGDDGSEWTHGDLEPSSFDLDLKPFLDVMNRMVTELAAIQANRRNPATAPQVKPRLGSCESCHFHSSGIGRRCGVHFFGEQCEGYIRECCCGGNPDPNFRNEPAKRDGGS